MGSIGNAPILRRTTFYDPSVLSMRVFTSAFEDAVNDENIIEAIKEYSYGVYGDEHEKEKFDEKYGISEFINKNTTLKQHNATLYRGVILTDAELSSLKVGADAGIHGLTSWSDREIAAHMYAVGDEYNNTMGNKRGNPVVFVDLNTNDSIPNPYTYPTNELLRSKSMRYKITKIESIDNYTNPIGRDEYDYAYTAPVTYVYVKSYKGN